MASAMIVTRQYLVDGKERSQEISNEVTTLAVMWDRNRNSLLAIEPTRALNEVWKPTLKKRM